MVRQGWRAQLAAVPFLGPALAFLLVFLLAPTLLSIFWGGTDKALTTSSFHWTGLANLREALGDDQVAVATRNTLLLVLISVPLSIVLGLGGTLQRVQITKVQHSTYYAELQIRGPNGPVRIDARPSDSIAIAIRLGAPIFAPEALLSSAAEREEDDDSQGYASPPAAPRAVREPDALTAEHQATLLAAEDRDELVVDDLHDLLGRV